VAETRYENLIVTELKENITLPFFRPGEVLDPVKPEERRRMNHVIWMDSEVVPGSFYSECVWFFPESMQTTKQAPNGGNEGGPQAHTHPFEEIITFFGTNRDDPHDLGGEVELWLEDEKFVMTESFLCYVPAGMKHCPLRINRIDRPIFHFTLGPGQAYGGELVAREQPGAGRTISRDELMKQFVFHDKPNLKLPEFRHEIPKERAYRIVYLDKETVPGAKFYTEALWFWPVERRKQKPGEPDTAPQAHTHPFSEMIAFFGTNPDDIHDLGGEVELWIGGERHVMTKSFVAFVPAGLEHCPLSINRIDRQILHFTAGPGAMYDSGDY
jgi:mannose-6-phosphate isomerase-like protein (cupin superfamily)